MTSYCLKPHWLQNLAQETLGPFVVWGSEELFWGGFLHDVSFIEEDDRVSHFPGKTHFMGDYQHGHAALGQFFHYIKTAIILVGEVGSSNASHLVA